MVEGAARRTANASRHCQGRWLDGDSRCNTASLQFQSSTKLCKDSNCFNQAFFAAFPGKLALLVLPFLAKPPLLDELRGSNSNPGGGMHCWRIVKMVCTNATGDIISFFLEPVLLVSAGSATLGSTGTGESLLLSGWILMSSICRRDIMIFIIHTWNIAASNNLNHCILMCIWSILKQITSTASLCIENLDFLSIWRTSGSIYSHVQNCTTPSLKIILLMLLGCIFQYPMSRSKQIILTYMSSYKWPGLNTYHDI